MYGLNGELTIINNAHIPEHTVNKSLCCNQLHVWNIPFDLMISENSKSDFICQPDEKEEDEEEMFFPGIHEYYY